MKKKRKRRRIDIVAKRKIFIHLLVAESSLRKIEEIIIIIFCIFLREMKKKHLIFSLRMIEMGKLSAFFPFFNLDEGWKFILIFPFFYAILLKTFKMKSTKVQTLAQFD